MLEKLHGYVSRDEKSLLVALDDQTPATSCWRSSRASRST